MTARATLTQAAIDRAAKAAKAQGLKVTVTAKDGTVYEFTPLDVTAESPHPAPKKWARG